MEKKQNIFLIIYLDDDDQIETEVKRKQDEFLDIYSLYQTTRLSWIKEELLAKAFEIHLLDPKFTFHIGSAP